MFTEVSKRAIWMIVLLVGGYVLCQAVADVAATKLVQIGSITMPAGTFIFAVTFTLRDLLHKRLGKEWARAAIVLAGVFNVVQATYLATVGTLPSPDFYHLTGAWGTIFALVPSITAASIIAEVISELVDTEVYHSWQRRFTFLPQWTRVLVSNAVSLPLDSLIFGTLAFSILPRLFGGGIVPFSVAMSIVCGQIIWKGIVTVISLPLIYLVKEKPEVTVA